MQAVTVLGLLPDDIENGVNELGTFGVMALGPVISGPGLAENEVIGAENLAVRAGSDAVHGTGFEVHEDSAGNESAATGLIVVYIDALELEVVVALVPPSRVDPMLCAHHLPELRPDLVPALPALYVKNLPHLQACSVRLSICVCVCE